MSYQQVKQAIKDIAAGKMVILQDDKDRENEGDLVVAADKITDKHVNFMTKYARGLVCMPMKSSAFKRLKIPMMVQNNQSAYQTGFGVSIGAANGMTTGISAIDRARTIQVAADPASSDLDIVKPGHIFPLCAREGGVFERKGHTEASVDLVYLAGCTPAAAICEIMCDDGSMARENDLEQFARKHQLTRISIQDLVDYRLQHEQLVTLEAQANLPTKYAKQMEIRIYHSVLDQYEWSVIIAGNPMQQVAPLVRLHSACMTGDLFGSCRCDCGEQLAQAMESIGDKGGILIYLPQEGRGIGLTNKIKAYALQDQGYDTVEANKVLGFSADLRDYVIAAKILKDLQVSQISLLSNNPNKMASLTKYGIEVIERVPLKTLPRTENLSYLKTKCEKLGHLLTME